MNNKRQNILVSDTRQEETCLFLNEIKGLWCREKPFSHLFLGKMNAVTQCEREVRKDYHDCNAQVNCFQCSK